MAFRYKILFYHENQRWVHKISSLLEVPMFHVIPTDSDEMVRQQLETGELEIILTAISSKSFSLSDDSGNSMGFKKTFLWDTVESEKRYGQVILLCKQSEIAFASDLVHSGKAADYFVVNPLLDKDRLLISIMKTIESNKLRSLIQAKILKNESISRHLLESIETLQILEDISTAEPTAADTPASSYWGEPVAPVSEEPLSNLALGATSVVDEAIMSETPLFPSETHGNTDVSSSFVNDSFFEEPESTSSLDFFSSLKSSLSEKAQDEEESSFEFGKNRKKKQKPGPLAHSWTKMQKSEYDVLLIDYHQESIRLVKQTLEENGYKVLVAESAEEGLDHLNNELFELLLLNKELPDHNGLDFLHKIRDRGPQSKIPTIMISENANESDVIRSVNVGANYFIVKPFNPKRFMKYIRDHLETS